MAITSLVLGIFSLLCFGIFTGLPAIILGHVSHSRSRRMPGQYAGGGMGIAGFILGYISIPITLLTVVVLFAEKSVMDDSRRTALVIDSETNLKGIGLAFRIWAGDNNDEFPFNVSQSKGGTMELCHPDKDGIEQNPVPTFMVMSNELAATGVLVCPNDKTKHKATDFASLTTDNISYELRTGPEVSEKNPAEVLAIDPVNGLVLHCDGTVERDAHYKRK